MERKDGERDGWGADLHFVGGGEGIARELGVGIGDIFGVGGINSCSLQAKVQIEQTDLGEEILQISRNCPF